MIPTHDTVIEWERIPDRMGIRRYISHPDGALRVLVGQEPHWQKNELLWHVSISHCERLPTWDEIAQARERFVPDRVTMGMILPPRAQYVNIHNYCLHLWEMEGER